MKSKETNSSMDELSTYLSSYDSKSLQSLIQNHEVLSSLADNVLDVVPIVCSVLDDVHYETNKDFICNCSKLLIKLAETANPKETVIVLLEQMDRFKSKLCFVALLQPIFVVFGKLPKKRTSFLKWALETSYASIKTFPLPAVTDDDVELKLCDLTETLLEFLKFLDKFIIKPFEEYTEAENLPEYKQIFVNTVVSIVQYPLVYFELDSNDDSISTCFDSLEKLCLKLCPNLFAFFEDLRDRKSDNFDDLKLGYAGMMHLLLCDQKLIQPCVYNHRYKCILLLRYCVILLTNDRVQSKGIFSCFQLIDKLAESSFELEILNVKEFQALPEALINLMIFNPKHKLRQDSLRLFNSYLIKFNNIGRYKLILRLMVKFSHSGVRGLLILKFKDLILSCLNSQTFDSVINHHEFAIVLNIILCIGGDDSIDLLENNDQIISALNFLRFIVMKDAENVTGIHDCGNKALCINFVEELRKNIKISQSHYLLEIENVVENKQNHDDESIVDLEDFAEKPYDKINVLRSALNTFDLILSLVVRFEEVLASLSSSNKS